jgi:hypothetical protein
MVSVVQKNNAKSFLVQSYPNAYTKNCFPTSITVWFLEGGGFKKKLPLGIFSNKEDYFLNYYFNQLNKFFKSSYLTYFLFVSECFI